MRNLIWLLFLSLSFACGDKEGAADDTGQSDADTDSDTDTGPDTDTDTGGLVHCVGDVMVTDAAGLAAMAGCELIDGSLSIESSDLTDLSGLSSLTSVGGDLSIWDNVTLCQSLVDAFIAALAAGLAGDVVHITGNDDSC
jgi:hypothetical protein